MIYIYIYRTNDNNEHNYFSTMYLSKCDKILHYL